MGHKITYIPREPVEEQEHWLWSKRTEIVACILILVMAIPILGVMLKWTVHQLTTMGV